MADPVAQNGDLQVHVYHLRPEPVVYQNTADLSFSPAAFTLIAGPHEAVLVDAPTTNAQGHEVADWIASTIPGKQVKAIYVTHGHGDHFFAARVIQQRFPHARIVATKDTYAHMLQQYEDAVFKSFWATLFPDKLDDRPLDDVDILPHDGTFYLEGHTLQAVEVGQGDTHSSTVLHVPSLDMVVGGDVVYGKCHQYFGENYTTELRGQWLKSLDKVAALNPSVVIPSHMQPNEGFGREHIEETKSYIHAYEEAVKGSTSWQELESGMQQRFPERVGNFILRWSAQTPYGAGF